MTAGRIVDARAQVVLPREHFQALLGAGEKPVTVESLAEAIHEEFCGTRGMGGIRDEVHWAQHIAIARGIHERL